MSSDEKINPGFGRPGVWSARGLVGQGFGRPLVLQETAGDRLADSPLAPTDRTPYFYNFKLA